MNRLTEFSTRGMNVAVFDIEADGQLQFRMGRHLSQDIRFILGEETGNLNDTSNTDNWASACAVDTDRLYVSAYSEDGRSVSAYRFSDGRMEWRTRLEDHGVGSSVLFDMVLEGDDIICCVYPYGALSMKRETGEVNWLTAACPGSRWVRVIDGRVILLTNGRFATLDLTGNLLYEYNFTGSPSLTPWHSTWTPGEAGFYYATTRNWDAHDHGYALHKFNVGFMDVDGNGVNANVFNITTTGALFGFALIVNASEDKLYSSTRFGLDDVSIFHAQMNVDGPADSFAVPGLFDGRTLACDSFGNVWVGGGYRESPSGSCNLACVNQNGVVQRYKLPWATTFRVAIQDNLLVVSGTGANVQGLVLNAFRVAD